VLGQASCQFANEATTGQVALCFPEDRKQPREGEGLTESYEIFNVLRSLNILRIVTKICCWAHLFSK
jgi:hypothetical protein